MTLKPLYRNILLASAALALVGGVAVSQTQPLPAIQWDVRRLDTLDRNVRRLERALTQRNAAGEPVLVESDPEVVQLQSRVAQMDRRLQDIEQTVQRMNGDVERLTFALDESGNANTALTTRLTAADARMKALEDALKAQAEQAAAPAEGASPTGDAGADLAAARALTDPARGGRALEAVIANWPGTSQAREAGWRLGDLRRANSDMAGAVQAYAGALNGWPSEPWAGETTLKLARALSATSRNPQACAALGEFDRRYAANASAALKTIAAQVRTQAECS